MDNDRQRVLENLNLFLIENFPQFRGINLTLDKAMVDIENDFGKSKCGTYVGMETDFGMIRYVIDALHDEYD